MKYGPPHGLLTFVSALFGLVATASPVGASSDYLVLDASGATGDIAVADRVVFSLGYGALLAAMDSEYVEKSYRRDGRPA